MPKKKPFFNLKKDIKQPKKFTTFPKSVSKQPKPKGKLPKLNPIQSSRPISIPIKNEKIPEKPPQTVAIKVMDTTIIPTIKGENTFPLQPAIITAPNPTPDEERLQQLLSDLRKIYMRNLLFPFIRGGGGVGDHTLLLNIGSNTHAQIDTHIGLTTSAHGGLLANVIEDLTPQLGGDLDLNDKNIDVKTTNTSSLGETGKALKELFTRIIESDSGDLVIKTPSLKTLKLNTPVYNDLVISIANGKVPAANYPTWAVFTTNLKTYTFALNDYIDLQSVEILHNWAEGTDIDLHLHIITNGLNNATARKAKYTIFFSLGDMNEVMAEEDSKTAEVDIAANLADKTHLYLDMGHITMTNYKIGTVVKLRLKRIAGTGTEPINDPFVEMVGIHYQIDTLGSREEAAK